MKKIPTSACRRCISSAAGLILATISFSAFADGTATINFETEGFDLDGGAIHADDITGDPDAPFVADSQFGLKAHGEIRRAEGV
jgi:hypothetical protein